MPGCACGYPDLQSASGGIGDLHGQPGAAYSPPG